MELPSWYFIALSVESFTFTSRPLTPQPWWFLILIGWIFYIDILLIWLLMVVSCRFTPLLWFLILVGWIFYIDIFANLTFNGWIMLIYSSPLIPYPYRMDLIHWHLVIWVLIVGSFTLTFILMVGSFTLTFILIVGSFTLTFRPRQLKIS